VKRPEERERGTVLGFLFPRDKGKVRQIHRKKVRRADWGERRKGLTHASSKRQLSKGETAWRKFLLGKRKFEESRLNLTREAAATVKKEGGNVPLR